MLTVGGRRPRHLDRLGIGEELVGQLLDRRRHRRREQQGLPLGRQLGADLLDVGDEAHVEHPVGLVDDQQVAAGEQDLAAVEQVHQPAGRGDQHVDALLERLDLVAHLTRRRSAAPSRACDACRISRNSRRPGRRARGSARGSASAACGARLRPWLENVDHRQHEAGGLAGAGLGDADDVAHPSAPAGSPGAGSASARYSRDFVTARSNSSERPRSAKLIKYPGVGLPSW